MLILSREPGESIIIGDTIKVMVVYIRNGKVRLGIEAPVDTDVHREEIWHRINGETKPATQIKDVEHD